MEIVGFIILSITIGFCSYFVGKWKQQIKTLNALGEWIHGDKYSSSEGANDLFHKVIKTC